ncbi:hypothetical protein GTA08_BOTSDO09448 [Neofusicoccum parvum]|uniref:Uncharacterized protein n=1 Tax=Botryosphaeria parva (strain UCR-NP2) TaxID=1287680 RepID=R1EAV9_BOTPV|nr:hypothetical protein UCRNP2_8363 [Neofusicoccum parvum UCRNP2]GME57165.1 hypothetical protein GTA08_BOTSDO09448 [Neofusicoccum parvum]
MSSNVGSKNIYEDGDQKNAPADQVNDAERFKEGKPNSHLALDSKDSRTIANKLAREEQREEQSGPEDIEAIQYEQDATLPAKSHGNKPSRGAVIDQQLREEDEQALKDKGSWGPTQ